MVHTGWSKLTAIAAKTGSLHWNGDSPEFWYPEQNIWYSPTIYPIRISGTPSYSPRETLHPLERYRNRTRSNLEGEFKIMKGYCISEEPIIKCAYLQEETSSEKAALSLEICSRH